MQNKIRRRRVRQSLDSQLPLEDSEEYKLFRHNSVASPLLRLPPELRIRIYELVLVVGQISVDYMPPRIASRQSSPLHTNNTADTAATNSLPCRRVEGGFYCRTFGADDDPWGAAGWSDRPGMRRSIRGPVEDKKRSGITPLSGVCRQLYHETILMPYSMNTWSFRHNVVMERYLAEKRLPWRQRRAIQTLYCSRMPSKEILKYFGGLKVLCWSDGKGLKRQALDNGKPVAT